MVLLEASVEGGSAAVDSEVAASVEAAAASAAAVRVEDGDA